MKTLKIISTILVVAFLMGACKNNKNTDEYVKKVQLKRETIAVGIYKPTGIKPLNFDYIAQAIKIDAGMVYVTLTDADILKTKIENIDVLIIPGLDMQTNYLPLDDELAEIFRKFVTVNGKSIVALGNSAQFIVNGSQNPLKIKGLIVNEKEQNIKGLLGFEIDNKHERILPELIGYDNLHTYFDNNVYYELTKDTSSTRLIAKIRSGDEYSPMIFDQECGLGKVLFVNAQLETTPGLRWIIPRMVREVLGKSIPSYRSNIVKPDLYNKDIIIDELAEKEIEILKLKLKQGSKKEALKAFEDINLYYPWLFAEVVRPYLIGRNDDLKFKAAEFIVNNEYTLALNDFDLAIKTERNKKNKALLKEYKVSLQQMTEQN